MDIISCTGANLEEDIMNLVAHTHYERIPHYRDLTRRTDGLCWKRTEPGNRYLHPGRGGIPQDPASHREDLEGCRSCQRTLFPHEYMYKLLLSEVMKDDYEIDPKTPG